MNILEYIKTENRSFKDFNFNPVDALIFSELSYAMPEKKCPLLLKEMGESKFADDFFNEHNNKKLISLIKDSERFSEILLISSETVIESGTPEFFRAMIFRISENLYFVAMGGTGAEVADWKEDFEMGYKMPIKSQEDALYFLEMEMTNLEGEFIVGGHSKGGNLAIYAAMSLPENYQERIVSVYSFDGPGFKKAVFDEKGYRNIRDKIEKYIPTSSIVGLIMENDTNARVIQSKGVGLVQHSAYNFVVRDKELVSGKLSKFVLDLNKLLSMWFKPKSDEERREFVETFFSLAEKSGVVSIEEFKTDFLSILPKMLEVYKSMDTDRKENFETALKELPKLWIEHFVSKKQE